jgi:hypothetical protein
MEVEIGFLTSLFPLQENPHLIKLSHCRTSLSFSPIQIFHSKCRHPVVVVVVLSPFTVAPLNP